MNPLRIVPFVLLPASLILAQPPAEFGARPPARDRIVTAPLVDSESDAAVAGERNLLVNGNFERGTRGWELIAFGKTGKMTIDAEELLEGKPTLRIENFQGDHSFVRQIVKGKPNTRYRLTAYIKTLNVQPVEGSGKEGAVVMIGMVLLVLPESVLYSASTSRLTSPPSCTVGVTLSTRPRSLY